MANTLFTGRKKKLNHFACVAINPGAWQIDCGRLTALVNPAPRVPFDLS